MATGLRQLFTYLPHRGVSGNSLPADSSFTDSLPLIGTRVLVPFGHSQRVGLVLGYADQSPVAQTKLKPISEVLDVQPLLPESIWKLGLWACEYYQYPMGDGMLHLLPVNLRQGHENKLSTRFWQRQIETPDFARAHKQAQVWQSLVALPAQFNDVQLSSVGLTRSDIKPLIDKAYIKLVKPANKTVVLALKSSPLQLNQEQKGAFTKVQKCMGSFGCFLLQGITGSGKTEVYLQLITACLKRGERALVLVPEIGLTHQLVERLQGRFQNSLITLHSGLTNSQRHNAWQLSCLGQGEIILGTRSAVFTPIPNLGLIIVDEEHDQAFKQQEGFRYHGRDVAIKRALQEDVVIVLGSATPSLESLANAQRKRYTLLQLTARAGGASQQDYEVIDMRNQQTNAGISEHLEQVIEHQLQAGHQVLLMLNRRGFSPSLQCLSCGMAVSCPACDTNMTLHKQPTRLHCHHCDHRQAVPVTCPQCHGQPMRPLGSGTERIEDRLQQRFMDYPILRIDRDTTRKKDALSDMLVQVHTGQPCLLVGTQMLAKGHHFPHVTAAVIVDADASLFCGDFRGAERLSQLIIQTAGRAGRANLPGKAYIQTYQADHPVLTTLTQQGYPVFALQELQAREMALLPPFGHIALFLVQARHEQKAYSLLMWLQRQFAQPHLQDLLPGLRHYGPMPALMARRANMYRVQLQLQHVSRGQLQKLCRELCRLFEAYPESKKVRWSLDIDPQDMG